ncbi:hypothetical protein RH831_03400 [Halodesulfurarchaeum sp. HSR-GB]|uniref:hypothetical protein n=1 Tax=Halodesulfurarchaeum sp. HSR-GB TaxID=3074077 RepID=UPI002867865C|nr:hypothetical protein [Halodesulfurarchaeum sp. HSR-GB]MDR5656225.1 hypothetical protein [Halodesulfurarchaeum sp. HSR-GB]
MAAERHFQLHPEYTDDDGNFFAVDTSGQFYLLSDTAPTDDRVDVSELSDGMRMLAIEDDEVVADLVLSDDLGPDEVPIVDGF